MTLSNISGNLRDRCCQVPNGEKLIYGDEKFMQYEEAGAKEAQHSAFVLVAGGLGERLGYSGIKVITT